MSTLRIVVPVLNEGRSLGPRLAALQPLRRRGVEVVVVDGGSTDETWLLARRFADRVLLAPRGRAAQMNAGAEGQGADALLFLHADTTLPPHADRLVAQALSGHSTWGRFDVRIASRHPLLRLVGWLMNLRSRWSGIATGDQAIFVRREAFLRSGGFPDIALMEDIALSVRLREHSAPACIREPAATSARRWEREGIVRTVLLMWCLRARFFFGADPQVLADRYGYARRPPTCAAALAILAKAPVPGFAKTRLVPTLGARAAARLHRHLTLETLHAARAAALGPVQLWCAPDPGHRMFLALQERCGIAALAQPEGNLGDRLLAVMQAHFDANAGLPLLIIGTDCPLLAPGHLQQAALELTRTDAVLIPAEDGGYVLLGLRRRVPGIFSGIAWSTPQVLAQTRERLAAAGASWCDLAPLWDIDDAQGWHRYRQLSEAAAPGKETTRHDAMETEGSRLVLRPPGGTAHAAPGGDRHRCGQ